MKTYSLGENIQQFGLEALGRYYSLYRGIVCDRSDPEEGQRGRIRVYIPAIQGGVRVWAVPLSQIGNYQSGVKYITPHINEVVYVLCEKGNPFKALWTYSGWSPKEVPDELKDDDTLGFLTPEGNKMILNDNEGVLTIRVGKADDENQTLITIDHGKVTVDIGEGDDHTTVEIDKGQTTINGGSNRGLVNIPSLEKALLAIQQDLIVAQSGTQISNWYASDDGYAALEDKNVTH